MYCVRVVCVYLSQLPKYGEITTFQMIMWMLVIGYSSKKTSGVGAHLVSQVYLRSFPKEMDYLKLHNYVKFGQSFQDLTYLKMCPSWGGGPTTKSWEIKKCVALRKPICD